MNKIKLDGKNNIIDQGYADLSKYNHSTGKLSDKEKQIIINKVNKQVTYDYYNKPVLKLKKTKESDYTTDMMKAKNTKYVSRTPKPGGGFNYTYAEDQKGGKSGWLDKFANFFGIKDRVLAIQKIKADYDKNQIKEKYNVSMDSWKNHLGEYFKNKEKWDKFFSGKKDKKEKKTADKKEQKEKKADKKKKSTIKLSVMKEIFGIYGGKVEKPVVNNFDTMPDKEPEKVVEPKDVEPVKEPEKIVDEEPEKEEETKEEKKEDKKEKPVKQTDSKEFKAWFGDSKVVDKSGKPLVVYHGSNSQFNKFNPSNDGIYFAKDKTHEFIEGTNFTYSSFIKIVKPYYTKKRAEIEGAIYKGDWNNNISFAAELKKKGYDGIIYEGGKDDDYPEVEYNPPQLVVFNPNQVKSATGNSGTFDPNSSDMTKATLIKDTKMKLINIYDKIFVRFEKAKGPVKHYKKVMIGGKMRYFYTKEQYSKYKESAHKPEKKTNKGGLLSGVMSFFGFKDDKQAKEKVTEIYNANKSSLSGIDKGTFTNYMDEYLSNKDKWDKKLQEKPKVIGKKKDGTKVAKKPSDKTVVMSGQAKKWDLSLMKKIAGVVGGVKGQTESEGGRDIENIPMDVAKMRSVKMPKEIKSKGIDSKEYKEWVKENWSKESPNNFATMPEAEGGNEKKAPFGELAKKLDPKSIDTLETGEFVAPEAARPKDFDEKTQTVLNPMTGKRVKISSLSKDYIEKNLPELEKKDGKYIEKDNFATMPEGVKSFLDRINNAKATIDLTGTLKGLDSGEIYKHIPEAKNHEEVIRDSINKRIGELNKEADKSEKDRKEKFIDKNKTEKKSLPKKDIDISTVEDINDRIKSIDSQIDTISSTPTKGGRVDVQKKKDDKITKLYNRKMDLENKKTKIMKKDTEKPSDKSQIMSHEEKVQELKDYYSDDSLDANKRILERMKELPNKEINVKALEELIKEKESKKESTKKIESIKNNFKDLSRDKKLYMLKDVGGREWEGYGKKRVYFNERSVKDILNLKVEYYKTGAISGATLDGKLISNSEAGKILSASDIFYDVDNEKFDSKYRMSRFDEVSEKIIEKINDKMNIEEQNKEPLKKEPSEEVLQTSYDKATQSIETFEDVNEKKLYDTEEEFNDYLKEMEDDWKENLKEPKDSKWYKEAVEELKKIKDYKQSLKDLLKLKEKLMGPKMFKAIKLNGKYYRLNKAKKMPIGTVNSKGYKKVAEGKWVKEGAGKPSQDDKKPKKDGKPEDKKKKEPTTDENSVKERVKTALKKMANILADALSGKDSVQPTGQAVEQAGEDIKRKKKPEKPEIEKPKEKPKAEKPKK